MSTILITGGSEGIGRAIAAELSSDHQVIILAQNETKLQSAATELGCDYAAADITDRDQIVPVVARLMEKYHHIDCLINNAGLWIEGPLETNDPKRIREVLAVNTQGTIMVTQAIVPSMKEQGSGRIINVISQAGLHPKPNVSVYDASKWAITGFTQALQLELAPAGIAVSGLYPGKVSTDLFKKAGIDKDMSNALKPSDVARAVRFIVDQPSHITIPELGLRHLAS